MGHALLLSAPYSCNPQPRNYHGKELIVLVHNALRMETGDSDQLGNVLHISYHVGRSEPPYPQRHLS